MFDIEIIKIILDVIIIIGKMLLSLAAVKMIYGIDRMWKTMYFTHPKLL